MALANGTVGLIHPFSAALSVVFEIPHALANCMAMNGLKEFYPAHIQFFENVCAQFKLLEKRIYLDFVDDSVLKRLIDSTIIHEKPLANHLGSSWRLILNDVRMSEIFKLILRRPDDEGEVLWQDTK